MAQFSLSPSVEVKEIDQTSYIPAVSTTIGATAGVFEWGPAHKIVNVDNEVSLIRVFGKPTENNFVDWFSAANYLGYSNYLKLVRVIDSTASKNAVTEGDATLVENEDIFEANPTGKSVNKIIARYPGSLGNSLLVSICDNAGFNSWEYKNAFTSSSKSTTSYKNVNFSRSGSFTTGQNVIVVNSTSGVRVGMDVYDGATASVVKNNAVLTIDSASITVDSTVGVVSGMNVYGTGIPDNTTVSSVNSGTNTIVLSVPVDITEDTRKSDLTFFDNTTATLIPAGAKVVSINNATSFTIDKIVTGTATNTQVFFHEIRTITTYPGQPYTSTQVDLEGGANDQLHIVVVDKSGKFSGEKGTILEKFSYLSKAVAAKDDSGMSNFYVDVVNMASNYIYITKPDLFYSAANSEMGDQFGAISRTIPGTGGTGSAIITLGAGYTTDILKSGMSVTGTGVAAGSKILKVLTTTTIELSATPESTVTSITVSGTSLDFTFTGGADGYTQITDSDRITNGFAKFVNQEEVDVNLVFAGNTTEQIADYLIDNIGEYRKDCMVFVSPPRTAVVNNDYPVDAIKDFRNVINSSSYAVLDTGWKLQYDRYNDKYRWIPLNPDIAGLVAQTERTNDAWWSPAGFNRGYIKNVVKLAYNPTVKGDRDELYQVGVNPVVTFPAMGTVLYGDKTLLARPSAFDRINVRRLFIVLEKAIATYSKFVLFEFNDQQTRSRFTNTIVPYLRNIQGRRGIIDFKVVADESVNTPDIIDSNAFVANILIKPNKSINFIQLRFVAVNTGANFEEVVAA